MAEENLAFVGTQTKNCQAHSESHAHCCHPNYVVSLEVRPLGVRQPVLLGSQQEYLATAVVRASCDTSSVHPRTRNLRQGIFVGLI